LGGGLRANFNLEQGIIADTGLLVVRVLSLIVSLGWAWRRQMLVLCSLVVLLV